MIVWVLVSAMAAYLGQNLEQALLERLLVVLLCSPDADIWHLACLDQRLSPAPSPQSISLRFQQNVSKHVDTQAPAQIYWGHDPKGYM